MDLNLDVLPCFFLLLLGPLTLTITVESGHDESSKTGSFLLFPGSPGNVSFWSGTDALVWVQETSQCQNSCKLWHSRPTGYWLVSIPWLFPLLLLPFSWNPRRTPSWGVSRDTRNMKLFLDSVLINFWTAVIHLRHRMGQGGIYYPQSHGMSTVVWESCWFFCYIELSGPVCKALIWVSMRVSCTGIWPTKSNFNYRLLSNVKPAPYMDIC